MMVSRAWKIGHGVGAAAVLAVPILAYSQRRWFQQSTKPDNAEEIRKQFGEAFKGPTDITKDQLPTIVQYEKVLSAGNSPFVVTYRDRLQIKDKLFLVDKVLGNDPKDIGEAYKTKIYYNKKFGGEDIGPESIILRIVTRFYYDQTAPDFFMEYENYAVEKAHVLWLKQLCRSMSAGISGVENNKYVIYHPFRLYTPRYWAGVLYLDEQQDYVFQVLYTRPLPPGVSQETLDEQTRKMFAQLTNAWAVQSLHFHAKTKEMLAKKPTGPIKVNPADVAPELVEKAKRYTEVTQQKVVGVPDLIALALQSAEFV